MSLDSIITPTKIETVLVYLDSPPRYEGDTKIWDEFEGWQGPGVSVWNPDYPFTIDSTIITWQIPQLSFNKTGIDTIRPIETYTWMWEEFVEWLKRELKRIRTHSHVK